MPAVRPDCRCAFLAWSCQEPEAAPPDRQPTWAHTVAAPAASVWVAILVLDLRCAGRPAAAHVESVRPVRAAARAGQGSQRSVPATSRRRVQARAMCAAADEIS